MSNKTITYASIVPLIGGESLAISNVLNGQDPEYVLSYSDFAANDDHYISYLREKRGWHGDYVFLDKETHYKPKSVDVVNTICPCAGLSSFSATPSADNLKNEWMVNTAKYVLEEIQPKVFWGENAPRLFSKSGRPVTNKMYSIARKNGYTLNLYFTKSILHGLSQIRPRTFYFFTKEDNRVPIFDYYKKDGGKAEDALSQKVIENDPMDVPINKSNPYSNPWIQYCMEKHDVTTLKDFFDSIKTTVIALPYAQQISNNNMLDVAEFIERKGFPQKTADRARAIQKKIDDGKGYWAHGNIVPKGIIPSLIAASATSMVNPFRDQYITLRDSFRLMGLPDDMDLSNATHYNAIFQNVPVTTASNMMTNVLSYLDGTCEMASGSFIRQSNEKKEVVEMFNKEKGSLSEFFNLHTTTTKI